MAEFPEFQQHCSATNPDVIRKITLLETKTSRWASDPNYLESMEDLRQKMIEIKESLEEIKKNIQDNIDDGTYVQERMAQLEETIFHLDEKVERLKKKLKDVTETINTREVACNFERDLATYVYPSGRRFGSERVYDNMIEWLEREDQTPDRIAANERWENLKTTVGWSPMHEEVLSRMKNYSTGHVYPTTENLEGVIDQISDDFNTQEKQYIIAIILAMIETNNLMAMQE